ncbi:restriction endonuclease subunit S [Lutibacter sp.]|uniref:restriction endonuclease subunit S n=1 Tax=Lutibacter sp. TaxID=1925666 RepID=UPI003562332A
MGAYIQLVDNRNKDLAVTNLLGINITKNFMTSVANVSGTDLSKYKIIQKGQFAYSAMQVGRDETIRLALYTENEPAIISPAYLVIESKDENELLSEYMMMWFQRPESDRYGWFISDSSVRASLDYDRLCEIEIPIPNINEQRKYVALYNGLLTNQKTYENSLEDLQLICDTYIEDLIKKEEPKLLGDFVELIEHRNSNLKYGVDDVRGVSNSKQFMPTKANNVGRDLQKFYVISPGDFVYNSRTTRMGDKVGLGYNNTEETFLTSWNNTAFRVKKDSIHLLIPAYLFLFFYRSEFDRYARFNSWGSSTELFNWDDMCNVKLPIPSIKIQEAIVTIYHTLETRKRINEQLKNTIKPLCPVLMRGVVESL